MSSYIDWKGIATALGQLKDMNEPSWYEKQEYIDYNEGIRREEKRVLDSATDKFNLYYGWYNNLEEQKATAVDQLNNISGQVGALSNGLDQSDPETMNKILQDNDLTKLKGLNNSIETLSDSIMQDLGTIDAYTTLNTNARFGSSLFNQEMIAYDERIHKDAENFKGYYIDKDGNKVENWDTDLSGVVSKNELHNAIEGTITMMNDAGINTRGVREGFWANYNSTKRTGQEIDMEQQLTNLISTGNAGSTPQVEAILKSNAKYLEKRADYVNDELLYKDVHLGDNVNEFKSNINLISDLGVEEPVGGAPNEHWERGGYEIMYDENGNEMGEKRLKWKKTKLRTDLEATNVKLLSEASANGYLHYFQNKPKVNWDNKFQIKQGNVSGDVGSRPVISYDDAGLSHDFYKSLTKDDSFPIMEMEIRDTGYEDDSGAFVKEGDIGIPTLMGYEKGEIGKQLSYDTKKEYEWAMQMIEDINAGTYQIRDGDMDRFNDFMSEMRIAFPRQFEDKIHLQLAINEAGADEETYQSIQSPKDDEAMRVELFDKHGEEEGTKLFNEYMSGTSKDRQVIGQRYYILYDLNTLQY